MKPSPSIILIFVLAFNLSTPLAHAATIHVPADQPTIQAGIDAAVDGDLVLVAPGAYVENVDFLGKAITLQSEQGADATVIDGGGNDSVVKISDGEPGASVLDGFLLRNGNAYKGGGVYSDSSNSTITNCMITDNVATSGGGVCATHSSLTLTNCMIWENWAEAGGA